jgi:hypothetical protein
VLKIGEETPRAPRLWIETNEDGGETSRAAALTLYPEFPARPSGCAGLPVEIIFLLDRYACTPGHSVSVSDHALGLRSRVHVSAS